QMNAGAAAATGEILCYLHADTSLPPGFAKAAREALAPSPVVAAAFDFAVDGGGLRAALISTLGTLRWRLSRRPYGDQGLCMPRSVYDALGGFPDQPVMEDWEFAGRLKRYGRIARIPLRAVTSRRVWNTYGLVRPTVVNLAVVGGYRAGVPLAVLSRWRHSIAQPDPARPPHAETTSPIAPAQETGE
ncbi:MAG TPA: hypothetical protein VLA05_05860, partial [Coriobacteriia bacterium]|nr:hypothetical protein [Coriobacteriia bacterium]